MKHYSITLCNRLPQDWAGTIAYSEGSNGLE